MSEPAAVPFEPIHPTEIIQEELDARGWTRADLANAMGMECCARNLLVLDMYFAVGPNDARCRLGRDTAERLGRAFETSAEFFLNIEDAWLRGIAECDEPAGETR